LSADWAGQIPPSGRVNAPEFLNSIYPGQKIALVLMAEGPDRDKMLNGIKIHVRFVSSKTGVAELRDLNPVAIRQIKAEGADVALLVLMAGGIAKKDLTEMEKNTSFVCFAVFQPDWTAPDVGTAGETQITATIAGNQKAIAIEPLKITVRPTTDWLKELPPGREELSKDSNRYHEYMPPGRLLARLGAMAKSGNLKIDSIVTYFAIAYRENVAARNAAIALFPVLDQDTKNALAFVLRLGGQDVGKLLPTVAPDTIASFNSVEPLGDPRVQLHFQDPVSPEQVRNIGVIMDRCWAGWMATGDQAYLKPLVGLLDGAADYPILQAWIKSRGGVKGLNAQVARGLAYQIAGWSIGSFERTDPHVSDWLLFWEKDSTFSPTVRKEIGTIAGNPAFRRN
jgi:hypothetical protein